MSAGRHPKRTPGAQDLRIKGTNRPPGRRLNPALRQMVAWACVGVGTNVSRANASPTLSFAVISADTGAHSG